MVKVGFKQRKALIHRGEWLQIELPNKIKLNKYVLGKRAITYAGIITKEGKVLGSTNGSTWNLIHQFSSTLKDQTIDVSHTTYYKYFRVVGTAVGGSATVMLIPEWELYGTQEDTGTPAIVGGPFAGKVANFRVYDQYLGDERIQEIYDAQKDEFGHKKSSMTFYKGRIGVGTTEPEGALTVLDEPRIMEKFPKYGISGHNVYVEGQGRFKLNAVDGNGELAFDELDRTSWDSVPPFDTRLSSDVDEGSWLKMETPEPTCLKKIVIESSNKWKQVGVELRQTSGLKGGIDTQSFGEAVGINKNGTKIAVAAPHFNSDTGYIKVFEWTSNVMTRSYEYNDPNYGTVPGTSTDSASFFFRMERDRKYYRWKW